MALWIIAGVLAFAFAGSGIMKLVQSKDKLVASPTGGWSPTLTNVTVPPCYGRCHRVRRFTPRTCAIVSDLSRGARRLIASIVTIL